MASEEYVSVADMWGIAKTIVSRRQYYRILERDEVKAMIRMCGRKRFIDATRFLDWMASYHVRQLSRARAAAAKAQEVEPRILDFLSKSPPVTIGVIARGIDRNADEVSSALKHLTLAGRVRMVDSSYKWALGDANVYRYPNVPAHCLGKSGGWLG